MTGLGGATTTRRRPLRRAAVGVLAALALAAPAAPAAAQQGGALQVVAGEELTYRVRSARFGTIGRGFMRVEGPVDVRGTAAYLLRFEFQTRIGPVKVVNRTASWVDTARGAALRFSKHERHPLSDHDEAVELYPAEQRWEGKGTGGETPTADPLDELSFIYLLRSLPLVVDSSYQLTRHFDPARNPTTLRVLRRETITTAAGEFRTIVVEMHVKDQRRYRGDGTLRFYLTDDAARVPVRMESQMRVVGAVSLDLEARATPASRAAMAAALPE